MTGDKPDGSLSLPRAGGDGERYAAYLLSEYFGEAIPFLVFRLKDGRRVAKAYHWLAEVEYRPDEGVWLAFPDAQFLVRGRNLLGLFMAVCGQAARLVWEADRATALLVPDGDPLVEAIERFPARR